MMKPYTQLLSTLLIVLLVAGCSPKREMVPNLEERVENFIENGNPINNLSGEPFTGILFQERDNGQIQIELRVKNGIPNGSYEFYHENGQLQVKGTYKDGEFDGLWESYYENGQLASKETYKAGELDGPYESYYKNGQLRVKGTFKAGEWDGPYEAYYENGQLKEKRTYKDGKLDGQRESYYENGQLSEKRTYKDGKLDGLWEQYYRNGQLRLKGTYKDGKEDGPYEAYYENGQLWRKITFKAGVYSDQLARYKEDGTEVELSLKSTDVYNYITDSIWMDRNIGASSVATSPDDPESYGNYFTFDQAQTACPDGYRLPTQAEWEAEEQTWSSSDAAGAYASPLKLPVAGNRGSSNGSLFDVGSNGSYWSGSVDGTDSRVLHFNSGFAYMYSSFRAFGYSVRCLKDTSD